MRPFITLADLNERMEPKTAWLTQRKFVSVLVKEVPSKQEFDDLLLDFGGFSLTIEIAHAQYRHEVQLISNLNLRSAYDTLFPLLYEEIFVRIVGKNREYMVWLPSDHDFYAIMFHDCDREIHTRERYFFSSVILKIGAMKIISEAEKAVI